MKKEKYYIPELEEFHSGFEFQCDFIDDDTYETTSVNQVFKLDGSWFNVEEDLQEEIDCGRIRVKFLDKEDFIKLGFNSQIKDTLAFGKVPVFKWSSKSYLSSSWKELTITKLSNTRFSFEIEIAKNYSTEVNKVEVTLKNKSELNKFLNQLNII